MPDLENELPRREKRRIRRAAWASYRRHKRDAGEDYDVGEVLECTLLDMKQQYSSGDLLSEAKQRFPWELVLAFLEQLIENMCPPE